MQRLRFSFEFAIVSRQGIATWKESLKPFTLTAIFSFMHENILAYWKTFAIPLTSLHLHSIANRHSMSSFAVDIERGLGNICREVDSAFYLHLCYYNFARFNFMWHSSRLLVEFINQHKSIYMLSWKLMQIRWQAAELIRVVLLQRSDGKSIKVWHISFVLIYDRVQSGAKDKQRRRRRETKKKNLICLMFNLRKFSSCHIQI